MPAVASTASKRSAVRLQSPYLVDGDCDDEDGEGDDGRRPLSSIVFRRPVAPRSRRPRFARDNPSEYEDAPSADYRTPHWPAKRFPSAVEPASATTALGSDAAGAADDDGDDGVDRGSSIAPARRDGTRGRIRSHLWERRDPRSADHDADPRAERHRTGTSDDAGEDLNLSRIAVAADDAATAAAAAAAVPTR